ncbi:hypothetical protein GCM10011511_00850 [Puia dinghuensis]|uniref:Uncharacterized protein n=2 Tax=Puia dinghuensis TaxID=1792502 RepID=A0A8J2U6F3_9BACT|nr:hypothetical protein GCM10011511_00850 [Puia dinghuensis]
MPNLAIIPERFEDLQRLSHNTTVYLSDLREEFRPDLQRFIVGETLTIHEGKIVMGNNTFQQWLEKIRTKGFDYEIAFK